MIEVDSVQTLTENIVAPLMRTARNNLVPLTVRHESVAEHCFHLASCVAILAPLYADVDVERALLIALSHDDGEAITGDVSVYAPPEDRRKKAVAEEVALERLSETVAGLSDDNLLLTYAKQYAA